MKHFFRENTFLALVGAGIAIMPLFSTAEHGALVHGANIAVAGPFIVKGLSGIRCKQFDVILSSLVLILVLITSFLRMGTIALMAGEICILCLLILFTVIGVMFREVERGRRM